MVFTSLAVLGTIALFLLEQRRTQTVLPILFDVPDFALTNQQDRVFTRADLLGKVWLADIIFTRCAGPCPVMTRKMAELQAALPADQPVRLVTLTTDPAYDTPEVLQAYAKRFGADPARWQFLTGTKSQIVRLAVNGLRLTAVEKEMGERESPEDLFIHSTILVLVDQRGRVRATFETDQPDLNSRVLTAVNALLTEL
jgi:cytochrome oxidase Cu insertion factor (SCO1/SenC/PrrC family)